MIGLLSKLRILIGLAAILSVLTPTAVHAERPAKAGETIKNEAKVRLVEHVTVKGNIIHLGDLFTNAGDKAHIAVAYAPAPGKRLVLDVRWLYRAASVYKLKWKPFSLRQRCVVERDSIVYGLDDIKGLLQTALAEHGIDKNAEIDLNNRMFRIYAPNWPDAKLNVSDIAIDKRSGQFTALLSVGAGRPNEVRRHVSGWIRHMTKVPVLTRHVKANEVIRKRDVQWSLIRTSRMQRDFATREEDLIGQASKHGLNPGQPIRLSDIQPPTLVTRGNLVTIILQNSFMRLTARGKALEDGSKGDSILVMNTKSKRKVEAVVTGPGEATVDLNGHLAMQMK